MIVDKEYCRQCGRLFEVGKLSNRGYCGRCWSSRLLETIRQLREHEGPVYEKWKSNYICSLQHVIRKLSSEDKNHAKDTQARNPS